MIKLVDLIHESQASQEAQRRGLKSIGFGRYTDPSTGKVVAKSEKGRLVALKGKAEPNGEPRQKGKEQPSFSHIGTQSDIPNMSTKQRKQVSMRIRHLAKLTQQARSQGKKAPNFNLCQITVPGTNLYCDDNLGIPRDQMPQFKGTPIPGSPASKLPKDRSGQVDTEKMFRQMLKKKGIKVAQTSVPSDQLKATQSELVGSKVAGMAMALEKDPNQSAITAPIYVSRDGYVLDGHHRWAAVTSAAIAAGQPANMKVNIVDMDAKDLVPLANKSARALGISTKAGK